MSRFFLICQKWPGTLKDPCFSWGPSVNKAQCKNNNLRISIVEEVIGLVVCSLKEAGEVVFCSAEALGVGLVSQQRHVCSKNNKDTTHWFVWLLVFSHLLFRPCCLSSTSCQLTPSPVPPWDLTSETTCVVVNARHQFCFAHVWIKFKRVFKSWRSQCRQTVTVKYIYLYISEIQLSAIRFWQRTDLHLDWPFMGRCVIGLTFHGQVCDRSTPVVSVIHAAHLHPHSGQKEFPQQGQIHGLKTPYVPPPMGAHVLIYWRKGLWGLKCLEWVLLSSGKEERGRVTTERRGRGDVVVSQEVLYVTRSFLFFCTRKRERELTGRFWLPVGLGLLFSSPESHIPDDEC